MSSTLEDLEQLIVARESARDRRDELGRLLELAQRRANLRPTQDAVALALCQPDDSDAMQTLLTPYRGSEHLLVSALVGLVQATGTHLASDDELRHFLEQLALQLATANPRDA